MKLWFRRIFVGVMLCLTPTICYAEEKKPVEEKKQAVVEGMTVTAQKQEQDVQDVPVAISAFSAMDLEDEMIEILDDVAKYTPGLTVINYGAAVKYAPSIRGLYSDYGTLSSTAGLFIDGVPVTNGLGFDETLLDIERIEVLRGPQGTLYGKNTEVGAINVITKKPTNETRGRITGELGEDNKYSLAGTASGALIEDILYLGISGKHYQKDGFVENTTTGEPVDDREHNYGKIYLRLTPTDNLEASLISSYIKYDNGGNSSGYTQTVGKKVSNDLDTFNRSSVWSNSLNVTYSLNDNLAFTAITAHRFFNEYLANDFDYTNNPNKKFHVFADSTYETLSQELRANYENDRISLVSGIFLETSDTHIDKEKDSSAAYTYTINDVYSDSIGLFSHLTYKITNKLSVLAGLRYDNVELEYQDASETINSSENELSPKVGVTYDLLENFKLYATIARGYRSGGFNSGAPEGYSKTFDPESLYSYEVGAKGVSINGKLAWDLALYYMDITDMQVDVYVDAENIIKTNAAAATSMGVEASLKYQITDSLNLFAGFSYNNTEFDEYNDGFTDYSGKQTTFSPEYNYFVGMKYRSKEGYYASADLSGYGDMYLDIDNEYKRPAYELVNAKIGYEMEHFDVYLYAKNLFDQDYSVEGHYYGVYSYYSQPREIGLSLTYRF